MTRGAWFGSVLLVALLLGGLAACSDDGTEDASGSGGADDSVPEAEARSHAVGLLEQTFVDEARTTPANGDLAEQPDRTLETTVLYPAEGDASSTTPVADAEPDASAGPYPLVVFSHGLGGSYEGYAPLLERWAAAGYVVAAPRFPLTYEDTPGGLNAADVQQQPGDVSFVVDEVLAAAAEDDGVLAGMVDEEAIAVAGHSNGGITTLGLVANSCCLEPRAEAAVVLAGTDGPFADGEYDLADTPPILFVHGTEDAQLSYDQAVSMFNQAEGPKGLLTIEGGEHGDWLAEGDDLEAVAAATTDFLDAELRGDEEAAAQLADFDVANMTLDWVAEDGSTTTIPTVPAPETDRVAEADPTEDLTAGQTVTVSWEGFLPDGTVNVVQCSGDGVSGGSAACDLTDAYILQPNPTGEGSTEIEVVVGPVGDGVCDAENDCWIVVNDSGLTEEDAVIRIPITFAA